MKNLKKALSLVLASAMLVGMMVVGTGAAHSDVKAEHNEEAIAVVSAAGIMGAGDTFNPDGEITRGEMAVIMTNMLGLDTKDFKGASNFTDAGWAADYIDACYANGIMAGVSATEFGTNVKVTTAQAALMMLKALGYYEKATLNDWMLDTIKMASKIDLLDGIDAKASAVLTRNEVAQLALNALEATCVEETAAGSNTSIKGEGFEITVDSTVYTADRTTSKYDYDGSKDGKLQLIESLFGNDFSKIENGKTKLGLPAVEWTQKVDKKTETIITVADEADETLIATKTVGVFALYQDKIDEDFEFDAEDDIEASAGDVVYYYENDDVVKAYIVSYELVQVTDIDEDLKKAEIADGHSFEVELTNVKTEDTYKVYDDNFAGYDYAEDDYVLVVMNKDEDEVYASELAEVVEGKVKSVTSTGKLNIDGTSYTNKSDTTLAFGDEATVVLNKAGQIIYVDELNASVKSDDFAYIYNVVASDEKDRNDDGVPSSETVYTAYVVLADGSKEKFVIEEDSAKAEGINEDWTGIVAYSINKDDEMVFEDSNLSVKIDDKKLNKDNKSVTTADGKVYADSKTEFIFADWNEKDKMVVTTATGVKNVNIDGQFAVVYDKDDLDALLVFVFSEDAGIESDAEYAVMIDTNYVYTEDEDGNAYYTYTVYVDGEETEMSFKKAQKQLADGKIFAYVIDGDYAVVDEDEYELIDGKVTYIGEDFIEIDGVEYTVDDAEIHTITTVMDEDGEYDYTEAEADGKIKKNAQVSFYANDDAEIELIFIHVTDD